MLKKGGIETIIIAVIMVAIVIGLVVVAIIPMSGTVQGTADEGKEKLESIWDE